MVYTQPFPPPAPPRRRWGRWALGGTLVAVVVALALLFTSGRLGAIIDLAAGRSPSASPTQSTPGVQDLSPFYEALNAALADRDRDLFFSHVTGAAVEPLELWWDNMDRLGWSTAAVTYASEGDRWALGPTARIQVLLGADMSYPQRGRNSSGAVTTMGFPYDATVDLSGAPVITEWVAVGGVRPWDVGPLEVVVGEGAVVAGLPEEREYLERLLPIAAEASAWTRSDYLIQRQQAPPCAGFLLFATMDPSRFATWFRGEESEPWVIDPAAITFSGNLPQPGTPGLDPALATGLWPSGGLVSVGPAGTGSDDAVTGLLVHEFAHVLQAIDTPSRAVSPPLSTLEGWADYQFLRFANGGPYPTSGPMGEYIGRCVSGPPAVPTDDDLRGEDSKCAYALASTLFAYAEQAGVPAIELVDEAAEHGVAPFGAAQRLGTSLAEEDWATWVLATYG